MNPAPIKKSHGFTLIELLIALSVFAVLAMLAYGGLNTMLNTRALTDQRADALRELQLAYRSVERDIDQWVPREIRDEFGRQIALHAVRQQTAPERTERNNLICATTSHQLDVLRLAHTGNDANFPGQ